MRHTLSTIVFLLAGLLVHAEDFRIASYNVENFQQHFEAHRLQMAATTRPSLISAEELRDRREENDKANWEVAQTILDKEFMPDVLAIVECCDQADLEFFNKHWLEGHYKTAIVFPTNTTRHQNLGLLLRDGFKLVQQKDQYYLEPDPGHNERGERLFARGPAFALIKSPAGHEFWLGITHMKSKSGDSVENTRWRNREAVRTRQIMLELHKTGPAEVILVGDMNDDVGESGFEKQCGGDTMANLVGPAGDGLELATRKLVESKAISFHGYWKPRYRSLIDHMVITHEMADEVKTVNIFTGGLSRVASDHYPIYMDLHTPEKN